jgi:signal transduction histidine kinase
VTDAFFRIGQEAVSNAIQHSGCKHLVLKLRISKREAQMTVHDDGRGFIEADALDGLGITGMRNRASRIRANLVLKTAQGLGTSIMVTVPLGITQGLLYRLHAMLIGNSRE